MATSPRTTDLHDLCGALDAVLVPRGFAAAQVGADEPSGQAIWCCGQGDFSARYPGLLSEADDDGRCVDLVVDFVIAADRGVDDGTWRVADVRLEGQRIEEALRQVGEAEAAVRAIGLMGAPTSAVTESLAQVVVTLLRAGSRPKPQSSP